MESAKIREMVSCYEHKSSYGTEPFFDEIKSLGESVLPYFIEAYPNSKRWQQRASYLYRAVSYANTSNNAVKLALLALSDKSKEVRYRACMLLACSQNKDVLPELYQAIKSAKFDTAADILAAIDAIESGNHNYFVDRSHSGNIKLNFQGRRNAT